MISFNAATKRKFVNRARQHQLADEIVQGQYWEKGKGCAVGCLVHGSSHEKLSEEMGIPLSMAYLIDRLFEDMPEKEAKLFPLRLVKAISVNANLDELMDQFVLVLLNDLKYGAINLPRERYWDRLDIQAAIDLYTRQVARDYPTSYNWIALEFRTYNPFSLASDLITYAARVHSRNRDIDVSTVSFYAAKTHSAARGHKGDIRAHCLWQSEMLLSLLRKQRKEK